MFLMEDAHDTKYYKLHDVELEQDVRVARLLAKPAAAAPSYHEQPPRSGCWSSTAAASSHRRHPRVWPLISPWATAHPRPRGRIRPPPTYNLTPEPYNLMPPPPIRDSVDTAVAGLTLPIVQAGAPDVRQGLALELAVSVFRPPPWQLP
jgi:hypothetical protein